MGVHRSAAQVKLICGLIAGSDAWLEQGSERLGEAFGPMDLRSDVFPFDATDYYVREMGEGLRRQFVAFARLLDPGELAGIKRRTNAMETEWVQGDPGAKRRRVNLDPGYVTPAKLVLATTKDFAHRIYLGEGIYAEVTLNFRKGGFRHFEWTYLDFVSGRYEAFLLAVRRRLMEQTAGDGHPPD